MPIKEIVEEYIGELGLDVIKEKLTNMVDEYKLKQAIQTYALQQFKSVFSYASLSEEIDYGGLCEYLKENFLDEVRACIFREDYSDKSYFESIQSKAITYSKADTFKKQESVRKFVRSVIKIIHNFYFKKLSENERFVISLTVENVDKLLKESERRIIDAMREPVDTVHEQLGDVEVVTCTRPALPSWAFDGRAAKMDEIKAALDNESKIVLLSGMGGIGKTEICRKLFEECEQGKVPGVQKVGWIAFGMDLQSSFLGQFPEVKSEDSQKYFYYAKAYLNRLGRGMLLFIDNANNLSEHDAADVATLGCKVILTSRRIFDRIKAIEIERLSIEACRTLYRRHSKDRASPDSDIDGIITLADRHTLALELLAKTQYACGKSPQEMLLILWEKGFSLEGISETIAYIHSPENFKGQEEAEALFIKHLSMVFDIARIDKTSEEYRVVQLFSMLAPEPDSVTGTMLKKWFTLKDLNALNALSNMGWLNKSIHPECAYSMHSLISAAVREKRDIKAIQLDSLALSIANSLQVGIAETFVSKLTFLAHAISAVRYVNKDSENYAGLLHNIAFMFYEKDDYMTALKWYQKALVVNKKVLGNKHPSIATTYHSIAGVYYSQGEYAKALEWYQKALAIREKVLGREHPDTAVTYNDIAGVYDRQGDYAKALEWNQRALVIKEKVLGKEHPDTATTYNNIAGVFTRQGDYPKALEWYQKALPIREKLLGKEHPDTAATDNNIGFVYSHQGKYTEALERYQKALAISEKVLGKDHPDTAISYNNMASVYYSQGDYPKALEWYQKALAISEKILGKEHPDTATTYNNIAGVYESQGDFPEALKRYQMALVISEKVLGKEHPDTAATYNNIAFVHFHQGCYPKALEWYQKALVVNEKVLGKEHPDTATIYNNIAGVYDSQGEYTKASEWYQKALVISEKVLGKDHPDTATIYNNIAGVYTSQGEYAKALEWYRKALEIFEAKLGPDHGYTEIVRDHLNSLVEK